MNLKPIRAFAPVLLCLWAMPARAGSPQNEIEVQRAYLNANKKDLVAQAMSLDAASAAKFWPLYDEYQEAMRPIGDRRVKLIMDFAGHYSDMTDAQAKSLLDDQLKIQDDLLSLQKKYVGKFRKAFPDTIVARYFQVENKISAAINIGLAKNIPLVPLP